MTAPVPGAPKVLSTGTLTAHGLTYEARVVEGKDGFPHVEARMSMLTWRPTTTEESDTYLPDAKPKAYYQIQAAPLEPTSQWRKSKNLDPGLTEQQAWEAIGAYSDQFPKSAPYRLVLVQPGYWVDEQVTLL